MVTRSNLRRAIRELKLSGLPLCVHASLRSFGQVEGGADAIVNSLLDEGCTIVVPAFSWLFAIHPPVHLRPPQNGVDYDRIEKESQALTRPYTPASIEIDDDMGAVAKAVLARDGRSRGSHPLNSFAAIGPLAEELVVHQTIIDVYSPLKALAEAGGAVVLMGVGLEAMTLLHLAEERVGRELFRRWARDPHGEPTMVAVGGCSMGFPRLEASLRTAVRQRFVGSSRWRVFDAASVLKAATEAIRQDPDVTHCANPDCERCRDAALGGPRLTKGAANEIVRQEGI
jgi:aminoglycoside 3-N-acetyltransferase